MYPDQSGARFEELRLKARRLVAELDAEELFVLAGIAKGMSKRAIAAVSRRCLEDVERTLASLMKKLNAVTIADLVRIAVYANPPWPH